MKFTLVLLFALIALSYCDESAAERSAHENDPAIKDLNAPKSDEFKENEKSLEKHDEEKREVPKIEETGDRFSTERSEPKLEWEREEYWSSPQALEEFKRNLERYPNFKHLDQEERRKELEKIWNFPETGFKMDRFTDENRHFFPDKQSDDNQAFEKKEQNQTQDDHLQENRQKESEQQSQRKEAVNETKQNNQSEHKRSNDTEEHDGKESWLDMAKYKWSNFTDSIKDYAGDKKENLKKKFSFYNESYFDEFHKDLPEDKWEKYLEMRDNKTNEKEGDSSLWDKAKGYFHDAKDKLSNISDFDDAKDKVKNWTKSYLGKENENEEGDRNERRGNDNETEKGDHHERRGKDEDYENRTKEDSDKHERRYRHKGEDKEEKEDRDYKKVDKEEKEDRDYKKDDKEEKEDRDYKKDDKEEKEDRDYKKDDKEEKEERHYRREEKDDDKEDKEERHHRREEKDENKENKKDDKEDMKESHRREDKDDDKEDKKDFKKDDKDDKSEFKEDRKDKRDFKMEDKEEKKGDKEIKFLEDKERN